MFSPDYSVIQKKRIVDVDIDSDSPITVQGISAENNHAQKKKKKNKKKKKRQVPEEIEAQPDSNNQETIANEQEQGGAEDDDQEEYKDQMQASHKKNSKRKPQNTQPVDIENYPEQQILMCSYNNCPMLVHISTVDIRLPNTFYSIQRKTRSKDEKNSFIQDRNVIEYCLDTGIKKYWEQRYFLFNKYDEGIKLDRESWYSATPEAVAQYITKRIKGAKVILDGFCGAGGDSIQFAHAAEKVISNDIDPEKIKLLENNANIYKVFEKIETKNSDFLKLDLGENQKVDLAYLAPPWGGTGYIKDDYSIFEMVTPDIRKILEKGFELSENIVFSLGRNTKLQEIVQLFAEHFERHNINPSCVGLEIEKVYVTGRLKLILVYYGSISALHRSKEYEYCYNLFLEDPLIKKMIKQLFKQYGLRQFLQWLQHREKKYELTLDDAKEYKTHIEAKQKAEFMKNNPLS